MLHPTIEELTNQDFNRYEIALATAKCARLINDEYVRQRDAAEKAMAGSKVAGGVDYTANTGVRQCGQQLCAIFVKRLVIIVGVSVKNNRFF